MKKYLLSLAALLLSSVLISDDVKNYAKLYIEQYSATAVSEMTRSGVPASITLAQGMLESSYGRSILATEGNNHFGIKCHSDWNGPSMRADDDAPGECFRKYDNPSASFRDHSDFLRYKSRYASLFDYPADDYRSWAFGLKAAGYATDPAYPKKLIDLIETYDLSRFDRVDIDSTSTVVAVPEAPTKLEQPVRTVSQGRKGTYTITLEREILSLNGIPFVYAREGESFRSIALVYDLYPSDLARHNDCKDPDRRLNTGEVVYLQRKARYAAKGLEKHVCSEGETLLEISQRYAMQMKSLMKLNGLKDNRLTMREDEVVLLRPAHIR